MVILQSILVGVATMVIGFFLIAFLKNINGNDKATIVIELIELVACIIFLVIGFDGSALIILIFPMWALLLLITSFIKKTLK